MSFIFCCRESNDLYRIVAQMGHPVTRFDRLHEALDAAQAGDALFVLADGYPDAPTELPVDFQETCQAKALRVYVEFARLGTEQAAGAVRATVHERVVVASDAFGETLKRGRILAVHDCHFIEMDHPAPLLVAARVAGFDMAVFGLPEERYPLLALSADGRIITAATKLSAFHTGRYSPSDAWRCIWNWILGQLAGDPALPSLGWTPAVHPSYGLSARVPEDLEARARSRGTQWFLKSRLLLHPSRVAEALQYGMSPAEVMPTPPADAPTGDGCEGILEGYASRIRHDGSQYQRAILRSDCICESAMALAFHAAGGNRDSGDIAANLLDFVYFRSDACKGPRGNPSHPAYGHIAWGVTGPTWTVATYGDDNARVLLATAAAAALLGNGRWDEGVMKALFANLRTTGVHGFRGDRIDIPELEANGWEHYYQRDLINPAPHYEAYLWACNLWAWRCTDDRRFIDRTREAIRMTMEAYPDGWHWTNGLAQEKARMLMPLAWLVRVEDTAEHRAWLDRIADDVIRLQDPCGAIREELGEASRGVFGAPRCNDDYGRHEAPLIQENGDPLCDLLYTTNFAFLGLHEAAAVGSARCREAADRLAEFLCRIQVQSEDHPELDGAWFRAFDFGRWEYWASNADIGWGAWSIETGWTQAWIVAVLAMRSRGVCLWDLVSSAGLSEHHAKLAPTFFPQTPTK